MNRLLPVFIAALFIPLASIAQGMEDIDPEILKMAESYQKQNENVPAELLALMPKELTVSEKNWMVEPSYKTLLQLSLTSSAAATRPHNDLGAEVQIIMTVYNMASSFGKMTAAQALKPQRTEMQKEWLNQHPAGTENERTGEKHEKIAVPKGYILLQKIVYADHHDGEGNVPGHIAYCGFLYQEVDNGVLIATIEERDGNKADIEKWLKHIAAGSGKLNTAKYFK
jgi:hypothetical protein